jgi:hypothetical protein
MDFICYTIETATTTSTQNPSEIKHLLKVHDIKMQFRSLKYKHAVQNKLE